ncbi:MAG: ABC transporter permease [Elusimicrobiales bacterium]
MKSLVIALKTGLAEIMLHKTRSVLSFLAIAVGAVVFIEAFSAICYTRERLRQQEKISGLARMRVTENNARAFSNADEYIPPPRMSYEDVQKLRAAAPSFYMISPECRDWHTALEYGGRRMAVGSLGVTPDWIKRDFIYTLRGRFINQRDMDDNMRVCVLINKAVEPPSSDSSKAARKRWDYAAAFDTIVSHNDMLGRQVKLEAITFTVVGVLDELPYSRRPYTMLNMRESDTKVLAPITTLTRYGIIRDRVETLNIDAGGERAYGESLRLVRNFLKIRYGDESYFIIDPQMEEIKKRAASDFQDALVKISLGMLAFIAGGIGIMNVTLATVFARVKEIGIRRAIGASRRDIMLQFMVEAMLLGLIGGVLGSALGWLWNGPVKTMMGMDGHMLPWIPLVSVLAAALTSFAFAIYPAWVAANLKPADALRAE